MKKRIASYLMLIGAMLIFGSIGIFRRYIPLSSGLLACARGFMGALVLLLYLKIKKHKIGLPPEKKSLVLLVLSGVAMGANWILLFEAFNYTSVAVATLCYYMEPTIVVLMSPIILKEKLPGKKIICVVISIAGMILVSGITDGGSLQIDGMRGVLFGLEAAVLYSTVVILNKLIDMDDAYGKTIIQLLSAAIVLVPYVLATEKNGFANISGLSVVMVLIVGIVHTGFAYALYFGSMKELSAQSIAVLSYLDPVSALIMAAIILHEKLSLAGLVGGILIIGAALLSEINIKKNKEK